MAYLDLEFRAQMTVAELRSEGGKSQRSNSSSACRQPIREGASLKLPADSTGTRRFLTSKVCTYLALAG